MECYPKSGGAQYSGRKLIKMFTAILAVTVMILDLRLGRCGIISSHCATTLYKYMQYSTRDRKIGAEACSH